MEVILLFFGKPIALQGVVHFTVEPGPARGILRCLDVLLHLLRAAHGARQAQIAVEPVVAAPHASKSKSRSAANAVEELLEELLEELMEQHREECDLAELMELIEELVQGYEGERTSSHDLRSDWRPRLECHLYEWEFLKHKRIAWANMTNV